MWIFKQGTRNGDALFFAARQLQAAFANLSLVAVRQTFDELVQVGRLCGLIDLGIRRFRAPIADVVEDGLIEQHRILRHDTDGCAQAVLRKIADIFAVDAYAAPLYVVKTVKQARQRRFAGT